MNIQLAREEYTAALNRGKKEYKELVAAGKCPHPAVLDTILGDQAYDIVQDLGIVEIPADRIVGTKSAGRISAFTPTFSPLLAMGTEFSIKWTLLCQDHIGDTGIREPIVCYEYLGNFYVQEGNKRVSVLRHFGATRIISSVKRILPKKSDEPRIRAYQEFLEFYKLSRLYTVQYRRPGDYAKLLAALDKSPADPWTEQERRAFQAYFLYFQNAFQALHTNEDILPEEALLLWLTLHSYRDLGQMTDSEIKNSLGALWADVVAGSRKSQLATEPQTPADSKPGILSRIISSGPDHLNIAFVHQLDAVSSNWVQGHESGRRHIENVFGDTVTARSYFNANTAEEAEAVLQQAISDGAQVVFTTAPKLSRATLKMAVRYPKIQFFNCSVDQPYSSVRTYYGRIYEAKFITGAIAGAMAENDRIGYIASNPIFGVPASINAFALGAQLTNPRARIELRWSCCEGSPQAEFFREGIRVVSNRDVPTRNRIYLEFCNYGTYLLDDRGEPVPLASPVWLWGNFYEQTVRSILSGSKNDRSDPTAINYWLGMDSGVIGINLSTKLPVGVRAMADWLEKGISSRKLDPFARKIIAQDGSIRNTGEGSFTPEQLLHMNWLCENVNGCIPGFEDILPMSQPLVRELGIYRNAIPAAKEADT